MPGRISCAALACGGWLAGGAALAQSSASNNQAFIDQQASSVTAPVSNEATLLQFGSGNRLGTIDNTVTQTSTEGAGNVFSSVQTGDGNLIGFTPGASSTLPLGQTGFANSASLGQTGTANVFGSLSQSNTEAGGDGNELALTQSGRGNLMFEVTQRNGRRGANRATISQTGEFNGVAAGQATSSGFAALSGVAGLAGRAFIGGADAPLQSVFAGQGLAAYSGPGETSGATLRQYGGGNRADIVIQGADNNFLVQQNSIGIGNGGGNAFAAVVNGSSNYVYGLQVGLNVANVSVIGSQNTFLLYQAGEAGAGSGGYGNLVSWQQGGSAGDIQNVAEIVQLGVNNTVTGSQMGSLNVFRSYQRGSNNLIEAAVAGSANRADIVQTGNNNVASISQGGPPRLLSR